MRIHCPHCLEETTLENSVADSAVVCPACKKAFDPRKKETLPNAGRGGDVELLPGICAGDGFGGYVLEKRLGRGGMGVVFQATQTSLGRKVALKVLAHELLNDPEFVRRFDREARVLASLSHPNIVQVIDKGIERGNVFLVMEFVDGVSLRDVLAEKKLPGPDAIKIVPALCDALEYAHSRGVVHRDIKPENILIGRDGSVKIADFGLARIVGEGPSGRITRSNAVMGSLDYMAPEQRERTRDADHRSDIYALGVVFYEMLTGELPLGRFEPPSKKVKLEIDLDEVVLKVLSKDPELRYQRASDVAAEIRKRSAAGAIPAGAPAITRENVARASKTAARSLSDFLDWFAGAWLPVRVAPLGLGAIIAAGALNGSDQHWGGYVRHVPAAAAFAGVLAGAVVVLSLWLRVFDRVPWRRSWSVTPSGNSHRFPVPATVLAGFAIIAAAAFDFPWDWFTPAAILPLVAAFVSKSPRLFTEVPDMRRHDHDPYKLPPEVAHLGQPMTPTSAPNVAVAPPPPAPPVQPAPPRPRLSIFGLLGFVAGAALFVAGSLLVGFLTWAKDDDWAILEDLVRGDSQARRTVMALLDARPFELHAAITWTGAIALLACALVFAFNAANLLSIGRRVGVRGAGFALFGALLAGAAGMEVMSAWDTLGKPARLWRQLAAAPDEEVTRTLFNEARIGRVAAVNVLARRESKVPLEEAAKADRSAAIRFLAAEALRRLRPPAERGMIDAPIDRWVLARRGSQLMAIKLLGNGTYDVSRYAVDGTRLRRLQAYTGCTLPATTLELPFEGIRWEPPSWIEPAPGVEVAVSPWRRSEEIDLEDSRLVWKTAVPVPPVETR